MKYWLKQKHFISYYIAIIKLDINNIKIENNKLKETDDESFKCYYFDDIIKNESFGFDNISIDEKSYKNVLVYDISFVWFCSKFVIRFDKIDEFIRVYQGIRYLVLFGLEKYVAFMIKYNILLVIKVVLHTLLLLISWK